MDKFILETFEECWYRCKVCGKGRPPNAFPRKKYSLSRYLNLYPKRNICVNCRKELKKGKIQHESDTDVNLNYVKY